MAVFAAEEDLRQSTIFDLLSLNCLSESPFPATLWCRAGAVTFLDIQNVQHKPDYYPDMILKLSGCAWKNKISGI